MHKTRKWWGYDFLFKLIEILTFFAFVCFLQVPDTSTKYKQFIWKRWLSFFLCFYFYNFFFVFLTSHHEIKKRQPSNVKTRNNKIKYMVYSKMSAEKCQAIKFLCFNICEKNGCLNNVGCFLQFFLVVIGKRGEMSKTNYTWRSPWRAVISSPTERKLIIIGDISCMFGCRAGIYRIKRCKLKLMKNAIHQHEHKQSIKRISLDGVCGARHTQRDWTN